MSNFCRAKVYVQPDCTGIWNDISEEGAAVSVDGGEVGIGEEFFFGLDYPVLAGGKPGRVNVTVRAQYTEDATEVTEVVRAIYEGGCDRDICVRWVPLGETVGNKQYTTVSGILTTPVWPGGEASSADITMIEFTVTCPTIDVDDVV